MPFDQEERLICEPESDNKLMMVVTRGQTGSDGPVTPTPSTTAPVCHSANATTVSDAGSVGRCGEHVASTDPTVSAPRDLLLSVEGERTRSFSLLFSHLASVEASLRAGDVAVRSALHTR